MSDIFERVLREADDEEPVDRLARLLKNALKKLYDNVRIEVQGDWRRITGVMGNDYTLSTYDDNTGVEIAVETSDGESIHISWSMIVTHGPYRSSGLARKTVEAVIETCDRSNEDAEITIGLEDWSEGFWEHMAEEYDWVSWDIRHDV
jgi:GNAT superfamily N-acetyltransferase